MRSILRACSNIGHSILCLSPLLHLCYFSAFIHPLGTYAINGDSVAQDHSHPRFLEDPEVLRLGKETRNYESDFIGLDRSIIGRADDDNQALANNAPSTLNIERNDSQFWVFPQQSLLGPKSPPTPGLPLVLLGQEPPPNPKSSDERILYISLNACKQPTPKSADSKSNPGQLELYVSTDPSNKKPSSSKNDHEILIDGGFGWLNISVKSDTYFGVFAPADDAFTGIYNYELTASIDGFYASQYKAPNAFPVDSDTNSVLLYTANTTNENSTTDIFQNWMKGPPAFSVFVNNLDNPSLRGMEKSLCALKNYADVNDPSVVDTGMTMAGDKGPKQQFHVRNLNASSDYFAITAIIGNSTKAGNGVVGGGGTVWSPTDVDVWNPVVTTNSTKFRTKSDSNCALIFNLTFCDSVAYAAPANPDNFSDVAALAQKYDNYAESMYKNFGYSLQQIACNTTSSAQYSLARNCTDCAAAYRQWLCAVTIPRCEDFSNKAKHLHPRNVNAAFPNATLADLAKNDEVLTEEYKNKPSHNQSRNPMIDKEINPGPYKEILPCTALCYELVQSCPASLQFVCPLEDHGLNETYWGKPGEKGIAECNYPGVIVKGSSSALKAKGVSAFLAAFSVALVVMAI